MEHMRSLKASTAVTVILFGIGCSQPSASATETPTPETTQSRGDKDSDVITAAALADPTIRSGDVLEAVRRLRPRFLMTRGTVSIVGKNAGLVHASVDFGPLTEVGALKRMRVAEISEIRYLNGREAALRFGTSAQTGGVILVTTRK